MLESDLYVPDLQDENGDLIKLELPEALPLYSPHRKINDPEPEVR